MKDRQVRVTKGLANLNKVLGSLERAVASNPAGELEIAGTIQNFEFVYELSWKAIQKLGDALGRTANSPRDAFQLGHELGLITEEKTWLKMIEDRNLSVHTYNEDLARQLLDRICRLYLAEFRAVAQSLGERVRGLAP